MLRGPRGRLTTVAVPETGLAGSSGSADGTGSEARFNNQFGVAVDSTGNVYVADSYNFTIRKGFPSSKAAPILMPPNVIAGQFGFGIAGPPGRSVDIESSRDLAQWQPVGSVVLDDGTNYFVSPTPLQGSQFYR